VARCSPRGHGMSRAPKGARSMAGYLQARGARLVRERRAPCAPIRRQPAAASAFINEYRDRTRHPCEVVIFRMACHVSRALSSSRRDVTHLLRESSGDTETYPCCQCSGDRGIGLWAFPAAHQDVAEQRRECAGNVGLNEWSPGRTGSSRPAAPRLRTRFSDPPPSPGSRE